MSAKKAFITVTSGPVGGIVYGHLSQFPGHYAVFGFDRGRELSAPCPRPGAAASSPMTAFILWMWPVPPDPRPPLRPRRFVPSPGQLPGALDQPVVDKK